MHKKSYIQGLGYGFISTIVILTIMLLFGLIGSIIIISSKEFNIKNNWFALLGGLVFIMVSIYYIIKLTLSNRMYFINNSLIIKHDTIEQKKISLDCINIEDYKILNEKKVGSVELILNDGKKYYLTRFSFNKNQLYNILKEIQKRGGLKNKDIDIIK